MSMDIASEKFLNEIKSKIHKTEDLIDKVIKSLDQGDITYARHALDEISYHLGRVMTLIETFRDELFKKQVELTKEKKGFKGIRQERQKILLTIEYEVCKQVCGEFFTPEGIKPKRIKLS